MVNKLVKRFNRYLEEELKEIDKVDSRLSKAIRIILEFERENLYKKRPNFKKEFEKILESLYGA